MIRPTRQPAADTPLRIPKPPLLAPDMNRGLQRAKPAASAAGAIAHPGSSDQALLHRGCPGDDLQRTAAARAALDLDARGGQVNIAPDRAAAQEPLGTIFTGPLLHCAGRTYAHRELSLQSGTKKRRNRS